MKNANPFVIKGYHGTEYFCDRQKESRQLRSAIANGRDVTLMAPRRYGKTGLIHNVFYHLPKTYKCIYLDIIFLPFLGISTYSTITFSITIVLQ